jgi:hypothetical protein
MEGKTEDASMNWSAGDLAMRWLHDTVKGVNVSFFSANTMLHILSLVLKAVQGIAAVRNI